MRFLEPTELFGFLTPAMSTASSEKQTPALFLPDDRPPRLKEDAKKAIRKLASYSRQTRIDRDAVIEQYTLAEQLTKEVEPPLILGLLLMKMKDREAALQHFGELKINHPDLPLPIRALAWLWFDKRSYGSGMDELAELVSKTPKAEQPDPQKDPQSMGEATG